MSLSDPHQPFTLPSQMQASPDVPQDDAAWCSECYRNLEDCPGHDDDPEALDVMASLVYALRTLPGLHPVPRSIVQEINRCEDYLRKHNPEYLGERF